VKKTGLTILCLLAASYPAMAKYHHHYDRHFHRHASYSQRHDHARVSPEMRAHVTCDMVRAYVAQLGIEQARAMARAAGMTMLEERKARHCLESESKA
jgi:hypothetical protein